MASRVSSIESHPQRDKIIEGILSGKPLRDVAACAIPPVTAASLCRFKNRSLLKSAATVAAARTAIANMDKGITPEVERAVTKAALTVASDPLLSRIAKHQATLDAEIGAAAGDARGIAALVGTDLRGIELHAKLTGRLDVQAQVTNVMIVCPQSQPAAAPEPAAESYDGLTIDIAPGR